MTFLIRSPTKCCKNVDFFTYFCPCKFNQILTTEVADQKGITDAVMLLEAPDETIDNIFGYSGIRTCFRASFFPST